MTDTDLFENAEFEREEILELGTSTKDDETETVPSYGSSEWHDYVMEQFHKDELIDGNPMTIGLRRVAEDLLGSIIVSRPTQIFVSGDEGPGKATVAFEVVIDWGDTGQLRTYGDVAETWHGNTDDLFAGHPAATASTKAEGRCLRKALKIRCVAAEELAKKDVAAHVRQSIKTETTDGDWSEKDKITAPQTNFLDAKCKQLDIDVMKFINSGKNTYKSINDVTKMAASNMIKELNEYQNNGKEIPEDIKGYEAWR